MSSASKGVRTGRRSIKALPVAALAIGTAGLFVTAPSAHADGAPQPHAFTAAATPHAATDDAKVSKLVADMRAAKARTAARSTASATSGGNGAKGATLDPMIIGGQTTTISAAPWMAQLYYIDDQGTADTSDDTVISCGGTVVAPTKIVTAGHCVSGMDWADNGFVVTGDTNYFLDETSDAPGTEVNGVWRQWSHPSFSSTTLDNDVAVLTLDTPVSAKPLPITTAADTASYRVGTSATVYGWGRTSSTTNDPSPTLKTATLPIAADASCDSYYSNYAVGHSVCAGQPASGSDTGTTAICNGDSGGPLVVGGRLVGVVSANVQDCVEQGSYSVFSKVSAYVGAIAPRLDDANLTSSTPYLDDDKADLVARTTGGDGYLYPSAGTRFGARQPFINFDGLNLIRQADLDSDDYQDLVLRTTGGQLYFESGNPDATGPVLVGGGWNAMKSLTLPGDLTGDGKADLFATDTAGNAYVYPGNGKGTFGTRVKIGAGWQVYGAVIYGKGDLNNDGLPDIVGRDSSGALWLYKGTGKASSPWAARTKVGSGWQIYTAMAATGDMTGDGRADLLARDSAGKLWLYQGTGSATSPYAGRVLIGSGWNIYNLFG